MENLLELVNTVLKIESTSSKELELVKWIAQALENKNINLTKDLFEINGQTTANLYAEIGNKNAVNKDTLIIYSHTDVVKAKPEQFFPKIENGKLFARGAADMKSALASQLFVLLNHKDYLEKLNKKIIFAFIADEETSSQGIRRFVNWAKSKNMKDFSMIFMEPTDDFEKIHIGGKGCIFLDLEGEIKTIIHSLKKIKSNKKLILEKYGDQKDGFGPSTLEITKITPEKRLSTSIVVTGKSTHASRPWLGNNALEATLDNYSDIIYLRTSDETTSNTIPDTCEVVLGAEDLKIKCRACIDIRTNLIGDKNDSLLNEVLSLVDTSIKTNLRMKDSAYLIKDRTLIEISKKAVNNSVEEFISIGGSDAPFVLELTNCLVSGFGPGRSEVCHSNNEYISIDVLEKTPETILKIIDNFCKA